MNSGGDGIKTVIYFVRHAQPNHNNHDDKTRELSEKGLSDRRLVTDFLEAQNIDAVLSSPYKRSVDTIKDFADKHGFSIRLVEDFRERKISDEWIEDFTAYSKAQWSDFDYKLPDGESLSEVQARNIRSLMSAIAEYPGKNVVIGSHGAALSTIINYFDSSFGYEDFNSIVGLMPWIVKFTFDGDCCTEIERIDLFSAKDSYQL